MSPRSSRRAWLVAYDIRHPKRLNKVHRLVSEQGLQIQYSLYLLWLSPNEHQALLDDLQALIHPVDDVRLYPLTEKPIWQHYGKPLLDADILLLNGEQTFLPPSS